ncbi:MAG TPA: SRPBCC domain-containing protein [Methyloceanibacter sp.]|nr:SRPBCC domain-containing protein [Methyloceanibacter sp.]
MNDTRTNVATGFEFVIRRQFDAPLDRVWRAWTEAERMAKWWGPKDFDIVSLKLDLRPGGTCYYMLRSPNGLDMWGRLTYREIVPQQKLVFIVAFSDEAGGISRHPLNEGWPLQILSTVTFTERAGRTTITVRWVPYEATDDEHNVFEEGKDSMQAGWTGTFDRLEAYLGKA